MLLLLFCEKDNPSTSFLLGAKVHLEQKSSRALHHCGLKAVLLSLMGWGGNKMNLVAKKN